MKKVLILFTAMAVIGIISNAQSGSVLLYGDLGISNTNSAADLNTTKYKLNPGIGYQFNDNWTVGANLNFYGQTVENSSTMKTKTPSFGVGPFLRYSHSFSKTFAFYTQLNAHYLAGKTKVETTGAADTETKWTGFEAYIAPALFINFKNSFGLNFGFGKLGFDTRKVDGASNSTTEFVFDFDWDSFTIGVSKNFGGKKKKK